jgi:hypothetical protein
MTTIRNQKTVLVAIAALATVLAVSTIAIGSVHAADTITTTVTKNTINSGVNVPTDTDQKQNCETGGGTSGIDASCHATSTDNIMQSGGYLKK